MEPVYVGLKKNAPSHVDPKDKCEMDVVTMMPIEDDDTVVILRDENGRFHCDVLTHLAQHFVHSVISTDKLPVYLKNRMPIPLSTYKSVLTSARENDPSFQPWLQSMIHDLGPERRSMVETGVRGIDTSFVNMTRGSRDMIEVDDDVFFSENTYAVNPNSQPPFVNTRRGSRRSRRRRAPRSPSASPPRRRRSRRR